VAATALRNPRRLRAILGLILAGAGLMSVLALLQHAGLSPVPVDVTRRTWVRVWGTTGNPIALGGYIVLLLPLVVALYAQSRRVFQFVYGALALALYAALIATEARAAWAALGLGIAVWMAVAGKTTIRRTARPLLVLALLCAAATPAVVWTMPPAYRGYAAESGSANVRLFLWRTSAPLVAQRPWFGWGPETLAQVYPAYGTPAFVRVFPAATMQHVIVDRPHNDLLQQAIASGVVGLAAYLWLWWAILCGAWRTARSRAYGDHGLGRGDDRRSLLVDPQIIGAGLLGGFASYLAQLQLSFSFVSVAPVFWVLVGTVAALRPRVAWTGRPGPV
jgi:O-antigen ligase